MRAMIGRVFGLVTITEAASILSAVFVDMSRGTAFITYNTRGFGREVGSGDELCAYCGKLMIPTRIINSRSVSRPDGDFYPRRGFGGDDDWVVRVTRKLALDHFRCFFFCFLCSSS